MGCSTLQMELTEAIFNSMFDWNSWRQLDSTGCLIPVDSHKDSLIQRQDPWATVDNIRLIKHTPFDWERTEQDATINVWIHEIEK